MNQNPSRKHHYLPRKYLRGFVNDSGSFHVYDKQSDKIFESNPAATFFENDLNTVSLENGSSSDFLEHLYADMEKQAWPALDSIRATDHLTVIDVKDKMNLFLFLSFLHWRLPNNIKHAEKLGKRFFEGDEEYSYLKILTRDGGDAPKEITDRIKNSKAWMKLSKSVIPFAPFFKGNTWAADLKNWKFLYTGDGKSWYLVGDNPIVTFGDRDHDPLTCLKQFMFPVSSNILLISCDTKIENTLEPGFALQYGAAIIERSERFVAFHRRDFLQAIIDFYKMHVSFDKTSTIIEELYKSLGGKKCDNGGT